jgi:hypothetical protein
VQIIFLQKILKRKSVTANIVAERRRLLELGAFNGRRYARCDAFTADETSSEASRTIALHVPKVGALTK